MNNIINRTPNNINITQSYIKDNSPRYNLNDLGSVYSHYDEATGRNVTTPNKLKGDVNNEDS